MARQVKKGTAWGCLILVFSPFLLVFMVLQTTEEAAAPENVLFLWLAIIGGIVWWARRVNHRANTTTRSTNPQRTTAPALGVPIPKPSRTIPQDVKIAVSVRDPGAREKIYAILTVCSFLLFLLMLGVSVVLAVLGVTKVPDWLAAPGGAGLIGVLVFGAAWRGAVENKRTFLREQEQKMRHEREMRIADAERARREEQDRVRAEEELRIAKAERARREEQKRIREEQKRIRIESLLRRDAVRDEINYMSGVEFEKFIADVLRQKGYTVEETPASGDQGVDLILPDYDGKRVAVQLKRWSGPVGNAVVGATFGGMAHYQAEEGWIITTSTFTPKARELARSTSVRLIDGKELAAWLEGLKEQE